MSMTKERAGEIALALVQRKVWEESVRLGDLHFQLESIAENTGMTLRELGELFVEHLLPYLIEEGFTARVTIELDYKKPGT